MKLKPFLKLKTIAREMTVRGGMGLNQVWIALFALAPSVRLFTSGVLFLLIELLLHISVFELHCSLGPLYSKDAAQTCQDRIPQKAGG